MVGEYVLCGNVGMGRSGSGKYIDKEGNTKDMIFTVPKLISYISNYFTLSKCDLIETSCWPFSQLDEGDLILTGTPSGVGQVSEGDVITGGIPGVMEISFAVASDSS